MSIYSGDENSPDEITSGPLDDEGFEDEDDEDSDLEDDEDSDLEDDEE